VPIIESGEQDGEVADLMLKKYLAPLAAQHIDTLILGCTHYSILKPKINALVNHQTQIICSGEVTAIKLADYLRRHPEIETRLSRGGRRRYLTTDLTPRFQDLASLFMGEAIEAEVVQL
jgi:glutamate racemase